MKKEIKLKAKKKTVFSKIHDGFSRKKTRYLLLMLVILPLLIVIGVFGMFLYKEAKNLMELAKGDESTVIKNENVVETMNYRLRDNATEYQKELFAQLKETLESEEYDDTLAAELVAKNYVADFYTFSNKAGQYDIGGMYYWYDEDDSKENAYLDARDGFYKYINYYGNQYGMENLIEVEDIQVTKCVKETDPIELSVHVAYKKDDNGEWYDYRENYSYDTYNVTLNWTYKEGYMPTTGRFATSVNMLIIKRDKFEIIYTSENPINVRLVKEEAQNAIEDTDTDTTETDYED